MAPFQLSRRQFAAGLAAAAAGAGFGVRAQAAFPTRPVRLHVGSSSGGAPDAAARTMARLLGEAWGQPVVIENRPGVSGLLAAEVTAQSAPDGHTLCLLLDTVLNTVPFLSEKMPIDPLKDLKPIGMVGSFPLVLVAHPGLKLRNLQDLVSEAKARPGRIDVASSGLGSSGHVAMELFNRAAGVQTNHVPYKGGLPALQDVLAGHVAMIWGSVGTCAPLVKDGKLVALGIGSSERFPLLPAVPTAREQGFANFSAGNWMGLLGPAALPDALVQKIYADVQRLAANNAYKETLLGQGIESRALASADLARLIRTEYDRNKSLFTSLGLAR